MWQTPLTDYAEELLLVLVDFLEVLVGIHLQLTAGSFVTGNDAVLVQLESADSPGVVNAAFYAVAQCASLVVTADEQQNLHGIADSADTDGQSGLGNFVGIVIKETGVDDQGILSQGTDAGAGGEGGKGLVESNVAVYTAAAHEQVDTAVGSDLVFVALALCFQIFSHTVQNVDILSRNVDVVEEIVVHEVPVALVMLSGQTNILVHIEGHNILEGDLTGLVHLDEALVNAQRGGTGGQTQNEGAVFCVVVDGIGDVVGSPLAHGVVIVFDDQFHICHTPCFIDKAPGLCPQRLLYTLRAVLSIPYF